MSAAEQISAARIAPDTMVAGRYRVLRVLGEGGMGVVYAAEHVLMRKEVALKVLHGDMSSMPEIVARFEREAIAAAHVDHPNVAAATDFGRLPDGACFLVLELLRGTGLREEIAKGPIPLPRALGILRGITAGIGAAHAKGIVHRDLKPDNVMLVERDERADFVKVLDFGIAKVDASVGDTPGTGAKLVTRVGTVFGTPEYMAPEQAVGDVVDARADLFALGVVFFEMLIGRCPFAGDTLAILRERILSNEPPDMSAIESDGARALIRKLLARQPEDRLQTANDVLTAIDELTTPTEVSLTLPAIIVPAPTVPVSFVPPIPRRRRWAVPALAAAALAVTFGGYALVHTLTRPHLQPTVETDPDPDPDPDASLPSPSASEDPPDDDPAPSADPAPIPSANTARAVRHRRPAPKARPRKHWGH